MKKLFFVLVVFALVVLTSCERVAPNYQGVLMENYGKNGKSDFSLQKGRVNVMMPGTELFQVPLWEQRGDFDDVLHLKAADNTEFTSKVVYSFKAIEDRCVDLVFENKQLGSDDGFMDALMNNILETKIYDIMKEESRKYTTDVLMATSTLSDGTVTSGSLKFENSVQEIVKKEFKSRGLELMTFSCLLQFTDAVTKKIDSRNEVNTNISVIEQQIIEQSKNKELAQIKAEIEMIPLVVAKRNGVADEYIKLKAYEAWTKASVPLYGNTPFSILQK